MRDNLSRKSLCLTHAISGYSKKRQAGFLLPLALFMIVVASGVALALLQQISKPSVSLTTSAMAVKSAYAAEVGAQLMANQLFFPVTVPAGDRQQMDNRCETLTINPVFNIAGLEQCRLTVRCECRYENNGVCDSGNSGNYDGSLGLEDSFYRIESEASCGSGFAQGYRRVELNKKAP